MSVFDMLGEVDGALNRWEVQSLSFDVVVVGGGHNGLAAASYLGRSGLTVGVIEKRKVVGGACTLDQPFADSRYLVSPCAYMVGLLHPLVIKELSLARLGYRAHLVDPVGWCPFEDGSSFTEWADDGRTAKELEDFAPRDVEGYFAYEAVYDRIRQRLRMNGHDTWVGDSPDRDAIEEMLDHDPELIEVLFEIPIADQLSRHIKDERLHTALHGAGVIGTWAGPRDPGTAAVRMMHKMGTIGGWGFVEGGMGRVSFALADSALESGVVFATGVEVTAIIPGEGVRLLGGDLVRARTVVSNLDPRETLRLCDLEDPTVVPRKFRRKVDNWSMESPVVKMNCGLTRLPHFTAAGSDQERAHRSVVTISTGVDSTQTAFEAAKEGEADPAWCELYFQTPYDPSVAPPDRHIMSVFAQYAPYTLAQGDWDSRRYGIGLRILDTIATFAPDVKDCVEEAEVLGPPDIEARIGLSEGHIFQGSCLPDQMWDRRFSPRTTVDGLYLCGAATHPGGSVMGINGRNAAMAVLADLGLEPELGSLRRLAFPNKGTT